MNVFLGNGAPWTVQLVLPDQLNLNVWKWGPSVDTFLEAPQVILKCSQGCQPQM